MSVEQLKKTVTADWRQRESARAKMRAPVRRILKRLERRAQKWDPVFRNYGATKQKPRASGLISN